MIILLRNDDAWRRLRDQSFQQAWQNLHTQCPWATVAQTVEFVNIWYETYQSRFSPLLLCGYTPEGVLTGLFPLALSSDGKELHPAGAHQGEYHGWLATPDTNDEFIQEAIETLGQSTSVKQIRIRCLPPSAPVCWVDSKPFWKRNCIVSTQRRPLLHLADVHIIAEFFSSKGCRRRLNRLKKLGLGELRFDLVGGQPNEQELESIITSYDLRMGAITGSCPFHDDPLKKRFYSRLLDIESLMHMTVLRVGKKWISAHIGGRNGRDIYLGILAYSPYFADISPGKFHIFKLAEMLASENFANIDLTPGGLYKDRFATNSEGVHGLQIFFRPGDFWKHRSIQILRSFASNTTKSLGIYPSTVRARLAAWRRLGRASLRHGSELGVYEFDLATVQRLEGRDVLTEDKLEDLLTFTPTESWQTRQVFLAEALTRVEAGERCYTRVEQGRLVTCIWRADALDEFMIAKPDQRLPFTAPSAVIHGLWTHPEAPNRVTIQAALLQVLHDAAAVSGNRSVFAVIQKNDPETVLAVKHCGGVERTH